MYDYIAIEGNIGAGKSELARIIAGEYNLELILEEYANKAYLERFYLDPARYAFPLEISFLVERYQQLNHYFSSGNLFKSGFISDYFFDKSMVFAYQNLNQDQYHLFKQLFDIFLPQVKFPDLLLYIHRPVNKVKENIEIRARLFESQIPVEYLESIEKGYHNYLKSLSNKRIVYVDLGEADFIQDERVKKKLLEIVNKEYPRKFSMESV